MKYEFLLDYIHKGFDFEIKEQYSKTLLTLDNNNINDRGIIIRNIIDWSLEN